jgi:hypothetical protein
LTPKYNGRILKWASFEVLLMVNMPSAVLQDVETYSIPTNTSNLKMEVAGSFEMLGTLNQATWCQVKFWQS